MSNANVRPYLLMIFFAIAVCKPLQAADDQVHVIPASELDQWWQAAPGNTAPKYPPLVVEGCVAVAFEIHGDGSVSNQRVWRSAWTDANLGRQIEQATLQTVPHWRFVPAPANASRDAVYTYQIFTNTLSLINPMPGTSPTPTASDRRRAERQSDENEAKCDMKDFPQQVQAMINSGINAKGGTQ